MVPWQALMAHRRPNLTASLAMLALAVRAVTTGVGAAVIVVVVVVEPCTISAYTADTVPMKLVSPEYVATTWRVPGEL